MGLTRIGRRLGTGMAALSLLAITACGGDASDTGESAGPPTTAQGDMGPDQPSEPADETHTDDSGEQLDPAALGQALLDAQTNAGTVHMDATVDAGGQSFDMVGDMRVDGRNVALDVSMSGAGLPQGGRLVIVDEIVYLKFPGMVPGNKFVAIDPKDKSNPLAQSFGGMLGAFDPSRSLAAFGAITGLKSHGREVLDGVQTTKYAVSVNTRKALKAQGVGMPVGQLPRSMKYTLWVDDDDLLRRFTFDAQGTTMRVSFTEWGEPVGISAPPRSQVTQLPQATG